MLSTGAVEAVLLEAQRLQQTVYLVLQLSDFGLLFNEQRHHLGGGIRECFINRFHGVDYTAPCLSYGVKMQRIKGLIAPPIKAVEQPVQLFTIEHQCCCGPIRPFKSLLLQTLVPQAKPVFFQYSILILSRRRLMNTNSTASKGLRFSCCSTSSDSEFAIMDF